MNEYNIAVEFQRGNIYTDLSVLVQNDYNAYKINFDFDKEFDRALFKLKYPVDNKVWIQEITDNQLILPVLVDKGDYEYEIAIYSEDGRLTDYATEKFHVRSELINTDEIVESDDRVPILDNLINTVNTLENNVTAAEKSRVSAESTRVENEDTRQSNENTRTENETVRQTNETTRINNEASRITAENNRILAESERVNNETTRVSNENTRISNENTRISNEETRVSNESTRALNEQTRIAKETAREEYIDNFKQDVEDGKFDGNGIASFTKTSTSGLVDTYTIVFTNGTTTTLNVTNGKGISSITKTSTSGLTDTYTITYNDNTTSTFQIINGRGITSIELTSTQDNIDTYTINYNDGTTSTFDVTNSTVTNQEFSDLQEEVIKYKTIRNILPKSEGEGNNIELNDTGNAFLEIMPIGNMSQKSTTGKQLYNHIDLLEEYSFLTPDEDGYYTAVCDNTNGTAGQYFNFTTKKSDNLETNTQYSIVTEIASISITGTATLNTWDSLGQFETGITTGYSTVGKFIGTPTTKTDFSSVTRMLASNIFASAGSKITIKFRISVIKGTDTTVDNFVYEPYTGGIVAPNPTIKFEEKEDCNFDNTWKQGQIAVETGEERPATNQIITTNYFRIYPNILYQLSRTVYSSYMMFRFYDINKNYLGYQQTSGMIATEETEKRMKANVSSMLFTITNSEVAYMRIADNSNDLSTIYTLKKLEETTPYAYPVKVASGEQQITIKNKNFLDLVNLTNNTDYTLNSDDSITISKNYGTNGRTFLNSLYLEAGTYTFSYIPNLTGNLNERFSIANLTNSTNIVNQNLTITNNQKTIYTFTLSEEAEIAFCLMPNQSTSGTLTIKNLMLEKNSISTEEYIKQQKQIFQLDLSKIGQRMKILKSKNFLENIIWQSGYISSNNEIVSASNWVHSGYINIENIQYYTAGQTGNNPKTILYDENFNVLEVLNLTINKTTDISVFNAKYIRISATETNLSSNQLFNEKTISFDIGLAKNDFFFKNKKDSKYYDNSLEQNKWYAKSHWEEEILTGEETITNNNQTDSIVGFSLRDYASIIDNSEPSNIWCNMLSPTSGGFPVNALRIATSGNIVLSFKKDFCEFSSAAAKAKIKEYYDNDIPFIIYIPLATPNDILITDEDLIEQLENLNNNARSYKETTYINCESLDEDDEVIKVNVIALKDLNIVLDTINDAILEIGGGN